MKKNLYGHIHRKSENQEKRFFLNEELVTDIDTVNELFRFVQESQSLYGEQDSLGAFWSKQQIVSLYKNIYTFGMYDKILEKLNGLYSALGSEELFTIDKKFLDNHYANLSDRREIAAAGMELGNRLSKVPGQLITKNIIQRDENGNVIQNGTRHWTKFYVSKLSELYNEYLENSGQWSFMEGVTIKNSPERLGVFNIESNNQKEYYLFLKWFRSKIDRLSNRKSFYCMFRDFYMYSKLKYCESYFYQMKHENMAELITMQEQGEIGIKITDSTRFDKKCNKNEEERKNTILLSTELPGYSKPYIFHFKLDRLNSILGRPESESLEIEPTIERQLGHTYFSHKLTEEQIEYIKKIRWQELDVIPITRDIIQYMKGSIEKKQEYEIAKERLDREKSNKGDDKVKKQEDNEQTKNVRKSLMKDQPFTDQLCESIEARLGIHIPEDYKNSQDSKTSLMYKSKTQKMKFSFMYNYMRDFLQTKLSETGKVFSNEELTDEANKMYVYMKLCGKGFWNLAYNDKRTVILEEVYKEYGDKFNSIAKAIQEGVPSDRLRDYVKKETSPNLKNGVSKGKRDFKSKKGTAKGLSSRNKKKQQAFQDEEDKSVDIKSKNNEKKKTTEECIKQALIDSIKTKKAQIELKKNELFLLQQELERLEKLNESMNGNYNIGEDD
ncbi:MAG: hypothetical protein J6D03_05075 [Clostridia bacterium]|nr:hypothetical protein [Clostridia bacterium]